MSHEHLCESCVYTKPNIGESCGGDYLYIEPKVACAGYEKNLAKPFFGGYANCDEQ